MSVQPMFFAPAQVSASRLMRRFHQDESGAMTIFTMFILVLMLVLAGMAVDFMRFESRRTIMQGAVDRAVLAAADLDQDLDPDAVVRDYVAKAQGANCLKGDPIIAAGSNFKSVTANCELPQNTYFLKFIGVDELTARATSTAIDGVGNVEISLVLDISGSMGSSVPGAGVTRLERLQEAATAFIDTLLIPEQEDRISISLIPYTTNVSAGPELLDALGVPRKHWFSNCINFRDAHYDQVNWPTEAAINDLTDVSNINRFEQAQHWAYNNWNTGACPIEDYEQIIPISQDRDALVGAISQMTPRASTAIFQGLKWGAALLDPSVNSAYRSLPANMRDPAFMDRPAGHGSAGNLGGTLKYIVVMTDGQNWDIRHLRDDQYNHESEIAHWGDQRYLDLYYSHLGRQWTYYDVTRMKYTRNQGDDLMDNICDAAKAEDIIIFSIAMGAPQQGVNQMRDCATTPNYFFETSGDELVQIFEEIAEQITDLRLTL